MESIQFTIRRANFAACYSQANAAFAQALSTPFSARALSAAEAGSDDPDTNAQFGWHRVRFLFLALFLRGTHLSVLHATLEPLLSDGCFMLLSWCCNSTTLPFHQEVHYSGAWECPNLARHCPGQPAVAVVLILLEAGLGQRLLHFPSQSHMPSRRATYDNAGTPQGQQDL